MIVSIDLAEALARAIVVALAWSLAGSVALAAFVAAVIAATRPSAKTRHVLWWPVFAASAVAPVAGVTGSLARVEHRTAAVAPGAVARAGAGTIAGVRLAAPSGSGRAADAVSVPFAASVMAHAAALAADVDAAPHAGEIAVAVWLAVACGGLATLGRGLVSLARIKREASTLDESVVRRLRRWRHSSRTGRAVSIAVSNAIDVPIAVGFRTPTILLPIALVEDETRTEIADLDQIAMHEYAHLDRFDDWTNLAERALVRVFWFSPVVRFAAARVALEREIACDDWVIAQTGRAHRYATCLWKLVERSRLPAHPIVAPGALFGPRQITIRIERLLDARRNARPRLSPLGALLGAAAFATLVVVQSVRAPAIALVDASPPIPASSAVLAPPVPPAVRADRSDLSNGGATPAQCSGCDLHGRDLRGRDLRGVTWTGVDVHDADLRSANLRGARLVGVDFRGARLDGATLRGASLTGCDFRRATTRGTDFSGVRAVATNLPGSD